jgi:hypothetical protein
MTTADEDVDFSDLDLIIAEDEARRAGARKLIKLKLLARKGTSSEERLRLNEEIEAYENLHTWTTVAAVALFHSQECLACGHKHRFFLGWMTQQQHRRDAHCSRMTRGRPLEPVPTQVVEHAQPPVEMCGDCCEAVLTIESIVGRVNADIEATTVAASRGRCSELRM